MIVQSNNFNLKQIAESGQCFRMNPVGENRYSIIAYGEYIELEQLDYDKIDLDCSRESFQSLWKNYFDLDYNYEEIIQCLKKGEDDFLRKAAEYGYGLRILRQEPFETLISFIISQNKNIPAIKSTIEKLCQKYGKEKKRSYGDGKTISYYTFPGPEDLAKASLKDLKSLGLGYRDKYILKAARTVKEGIVDLNDLCSYEYEESLMKLKSFYGVGDKVANCVSLFAYHHIDAYPVDVWIKKVLEQIYGNNFDWNLYKGYAGIVQQYMFYYIRNNH